MAELSREAPAQAPTRGLSGWCGSHRTLKGRACPQTAARPCDVQLWQRFSESTVIADTARVEQEKSDPR